MPARNTNSIPNIHRCLKADVCRALGVDWATFEARVEAGLWEVLERSGKHRYYSLPTLAQAEFEYRSGKVRGVTNIETARLKRAQAEKVELANAVERRELVLRTAVEVEYAETVATLNAMLEGLASRLASQLVDMTDVLAITHLIDSEIEEIKATAAKRLGVEDASG